MIIINYYINRSTKKKNQQQQLNHRLSIAFSCLFLSFSLFLIHLFIYLFIFFVLFCLAGWDDDDDKFLLFSLLLFFSTITLNHLKFITMKPTKKNFLYLTCAFFCSLFKYFLHLYCVYLYFFSLSFSKK